MHFTRYFLFSTLFVLFVTHPQMATAQAISRTNSPLPFDQVAPATLAKSAKKVFAHWHNYPIRFANENPAEDIYADWLKPRGDYKSIGGRLRDRPVPRMPGTSDFIFLDQLEDVSTAASAGLDAFLMNTWFGQDDNRWNRFLESMFDASDAYTKTHTPGFSTAFNLDVHIISNNLTAAQKASDGEMTHLAQVWADRMATFKNRLSYFKINGKYVVGFFHANVLRPIFIRAFYQRLVNYHKISPYLITFNMGETLDYRAAVKPYIGAFGAWTIAPYNVSKPQQSLHDWAQTNKVPYVQSVTFSDHRAPANSFIETGGFQSLSNSWMNAIHNNAPLVHLQTWNDHGEGHAQRPNTAQQYVPLDLTAYYTQYFKTGKKPVIVRDVVYYAHRMHLSNVVPKTGPKMREATGVLPVDRVFALGFLKKGGQLRITSGANQMTQTIADAAANSGPVFYDAPLKVNDRPSFDILRNGTSAAHVKSAFQTRSGVIEYMDMQYRAGSSSRPPIAGVQNNLPQDRD